jgi:RNA-directed DNA polymerase
MAHVREPLINVDRNDKPKRLTGLNQQVRRGLSPEVLGIHGHQRCRRKGGAERTRVAQAERGHPVQLPHGKACRKAHREMCGHRMAEEAKATLYSGGYGFQGHPPRTWADIRLVFHGARAWAPGLGRKAVITDNVDAPSSAPFAWHHINWRHGHRIARRLPARIAKATPEGNRRKVKSLQRVLASSCSAKAIAVKRVTANNGATTPGVDKVLWSTPEDKMRAVRSLTRRGYRPPPLRRVYSPKASHGLRPLGIPTIRARARQALHLLTWEPIAETTAAGNSSGFRPERSTADAIEPGFIALGRRGSPAWVLAGEIKGCFDHSNHDWLLAHIPMDKAMLQAWLQAGVIDRNQLFPTTMGTPHGGVRSPAVMNMALDGLAAELRQAFGRKDNGHMIRYADDVIITGSSPERLEGEVKPRVERFLAIRGGELSQEKTKITPIEEGFAFLGQHLRKYTGTLLITPAKKNVQAFMRQVRGLVQAHKTATHEPMMRQLNPVIRGWANYQRAIVAKATFSKVDALIWRTLWQWAKRRPPNTGAAWIKARDLVTDGLRNWVFTANITMPDGKSARLTLVNPADTPIRRHTKIKAQANPFAPAWEPDVETRLGLTLQETLAGTRRLYRLWQDQERRCPNCSQTITQDTGWHVHHILPRSNGGQDILSNRVMVHPNCHRQIHHQQLAVVQLAPGHRGCRKT